MIRQQSTKIALIDGDYLTYSCGFSSDSLAKKAGEEREPLSYCLEGVRKTILKILDNTKATDYSIFLTGNSNFREEVATTHKYKGNRDPTHKPIWYKEIKEYLINNWKAEIVEGYEADDAQAFTQLQCPEDTVICGVDKDLLMIPGDHYNWKKDIYFSIDTLEDGLLNFFSQLLTGDTTDNIKGLRGIGPKKAEKILDGLTSSKDRLKAVGLWYAIKEDNPEERLVENAKLLWMMREEGVQFDLDRMMDKLYAS